MIQVHIFISGYVHSVGFRRFIQREAVRRGLVGWVRNLSDRRVETVIQSSTGSGNKDKEKLEEMVLLCRKGPMMAEVKSINIIWQIAESVGQREKYRSFEILPTV